jgi:hypothetical protein
VVVFVVCTVVILLASEELALITLLCRASILVATELELVLTVLVSEFIDELRELDAL